MKRFIVLSGVLVLAAAAAQAFDVALTGTEITIHYKEPTTDADGTPLEDLMQTELYYQLEGSTVAVQAKGVNATNPNGGGTITERLVLPVNDNEEKNFTVWAAARDRSGNLSGSTAKVPVRIDRMPPAPPQ